MRRLFIIQSCLLVLSILCPSAARAAAAVAVGSNGIYAYRVDRYESIRQVSEKAIKRCQEHGGTNVKIIGSSDSPGCGALAVSGDGASRVFGCSFSQIKWEDAAKLAIAQCQRNGGKNPTIKEKWCQGKQGRY
jgi:hypothetical protein